MRLRRTRALCFSSLISLVVPRAERVSPAPRTSYQPPVPHPRQVLRRREIGPPRGSLFRCCSKRIIHLDDCRRFCTDLPLWHAPLHPRQVPAMLTQQAVGIAQIAKETGLTRQTIHRIKDDPAGAEVALGV